VSGSTESILDQNGRPPAAQKVADADTDALTRSAGRGALWQLLGGLWQNFVGLGASMVLARTLFPKDFGIVGMAVLAQGLISRVGYLSSSMGLVAKSDISEEDIATAFWMSVFVQGSLFVVMFTGAPLFASFFKTPELTWVLRATSFGFLITAAGAIHSSLMAKRLQFGALQIIEGGGVALQSGVAILFAVVFHMGYWSLVLPILLGNLSMSVARIACVRWAPSLRFSRKSFRHLFRYSANSFGLSLVEYFHFNLDYILVGRLLGATVLGLYEFAYRIPHRVFNAVARPVASVLFPTLAKAQASDERLAAGYGKTVRYLSILLFPVLGGFAVVARPAVLVLWGEQWSPVVIPLQILCFASAVRCITTSIGAVFLCKNRPDIPFKISLVQLVITIIAVGGLGYFYGLVGVAAGVAVSTIPSLFAVWLAFRMTRTPLRRIRRSLAPAFVSTAVSCAAAGLSLFAMESRGYGPFPVLAVAVPAGAIGYVASLRLVFPVTLRDIWNTVRIVVGRRTGSGPVPLT
jgi:PST family polysaccharide transporter